MTTKELLALASDWRRAAHQLRGDSEPMPASAMRLDECADELEAALASDTGGQGAAEAWDEGYRMGVNDERISEANIGIAGFDAKIEPARENPYRAALRAQPAGGGDAALGMRFGAGEIGVFTGTYEGEPAVLLYEAPKLGSVGDEVSYNDGMPLRCALTFPTAAQAQAVMDALAPAATSEPTPTGWVRNTDGKWEVRIGGPCPANRSGGYSTPWTAVYDTPTARLAFATPPESGGHGEAVTEVRHFTAGLRENNWNLQSPDTLAHYIAGALDAVLTAITQGGGNGR